MIKLLIYGAGFYWLFKKVGVINGNTSLKGHEYDSQNYDHPLNGDCTACPHEHPELQKQIDALKRG